MILKAGLIVSFFMHMRRERPALRCASLFPPIAVPVLVGLMALEAEYTLLTRLVFFAKGF